MLAQAQSNSTPLKVGDAIPDVTLRTEENKEVSLRKLVSEKPTVLISHLREIFLHFSCTFGFRSSLELQNRFSALQKRNVTQAET